MPLMQSIEGSDDELLDETEQTASTMTLPKEGTATDEWRPIAMLNYMRKLLAALIAGMAEVRPRPAID